eukprot:scaffold106584_cov18-Phaeocystis_antarctica.AAC.1
MGWGQDWGWGLGFGFEVPLETSPAYMRARRDPIMSLGEKATRCRRRPRGWSWGSVLGLWLG